MADRHSSNSMGYNGIGFYFSITILGVLAIAIAAASFLLGTVDRNFLFNSDSMYLPMLFDDVFKEGGNFFSWHLTPAPGFFPDMALFFIARALLTNTFWNFILFAVLQVGISYVLNLVLIRTIEVDPKRRASASLVFSTFFVVAIALFTFKNSIPYVHVLVPVYRFGAVFNTLILILCLSIAWNTRHRLASWGIFLICLVATATDIMFLPIAVIPAIASLLFTSLHLKIITTKRWSIFISILMISGAFIGLFIKNLLINTDTTSRYIGLGYTPFLQQIKSLAVLIHQTNLQNPLIGITLLGFYLSISIQFFSRISKDAGSPTENTKIIYLLLFLMASPVITGVAVILNGVVTGAPHDLRYISNFYWLPVFFSWLPFHPLSLSRRFLKASVLSLSIFATLQLFPIVRFQTDYVPEVVQCIDNAISAYEQATGEVIDKGLSFYWEAKLISHYSQKNLSILQFFPDLSPYFWINNEDWYTNDTYDFAVLTAPNQSPEAAPMKESILALNGIPIETKTCSLSDGRNFEIMLYGSDKLRIK